MKKKRKINSNLIFNIIVAGLSIYLICNFVFTEDGLIDLLKSSSGINFFWIGAALVVFDMNIVIDGLAMTVSSDPNSAIATLDTVRRVRDEFERSGSFDYGVRV